MTATADVVVVGGGIAGSGLATVLARKGFDVLVLERETTYRDKVRGETMTPWGVAEVFRRGLQEALLGAGGGYCTRAILYDETLEPEEAEALTFALDNIVAGVPGSLNVGHPDACPALIEAAAKSGARVVRGVGAVTVAPCAAPSVTYELDDQEHHVRCRLVVGADGRARRKAWQSRMFDDALLAAPVMIQLAGPETAPAEAFAPKNLERIRALS